MTISSTPPSQALCEASQQNAIVLGAISGLVAGVVRDVAGNEISNSVQGQTLTADLANILVNQEICEQLKSKKV